MTASLPGRQPPAASRQPARGVLLLILALSGASCCSYPLGSPGPGEEEGGARPTIPLPAELVERFTPVHPAWGLELEALESRADREHYRFRLQTFSEVYQDFRVITGEYVRTLRTPPGARSPLILDSPILGGAKDSYLADRIFARWAAQKGLSTFFLHQEKDILRAERDSLELDRLLRDNVISYRKAMEALLRERPELDPDKLGSFGISLGALKNVVLMAVEPRLRANVLCLAGGDLPRILLESRERMVMRYLERRAQRDGLSPAEVAEELRRTVKAEPLLFAQSVPPESVILFLGSLDNKVPYGQGLELRRALGRCRLHTFPLGHYTGILAAPIAASRGFTWMKERFAEAPTPR